MATRTLDPLEKLWRRAEKLLVECLFDEVGDEDLARRAAKAYSRFAHYGLEREFTECSCEACV